jgi:hypothetical protein
MRHFTLTTAAFFLAFAGFTQNDDMILKPEFSRFKIGLNVTPDMGYRVIMVSSGTSASELYESIKKDRDESEIPKMGFSAGVTVNYNLSKKVGIEAGLQYASRGYTYETEEIIFAQNINPLTGFGTNFFGSIIPTQATFKYNWNYLEVPLRFVFTSGAKKVKFLASAGASAGLLLNAQQTTIVKYLDGSETNSTDEMTGNFRQFVISPQLSLGAEYQVSQHFHLRFEPIVRYAVQSLVDSPLKTNLASAGLLVSGYVAF